MAITINGDGLIDIGGTTSTQGRVRLAEDADNGTNYVELTAPASVASNRVITFPDATTEVVGTDTTQTLTNKTLTSPTINGGTVSSATLTSPTISGTPVVNGSLVVSGTSITLTNQTAPEFTGIPPWAKRITLMFQGVSSNSGNPLLIQLGTGSPSPTYVASNYLGSSTSMDTGVATSTYTTGFGIRSVSAVNFLNGNVVITNINGNAWTASGNLAFSNAAASLITAGSVSLGAALTAVRLYIDGTQFFDGGTINIIYE